MVDKNIGNWSICCADLSAGNRWKVQTSSIINGGVALGKWK